MTAPPLDLYEIAYLAGGPDRVVDTALVALVESGRVRVHAPGELAVVEPGRQHPVEAAVMDAVGTRGHRSVDTVRWRLADDERIAGLGRSLAAAGLLRRPALDGSGALRVARHGRSALPDMALRAQIFERLLPPVPRDGIARRLRAAADADPRYQAHRTGAAGIGGAAAIGFLEGGGGDGGGF